jgi:signal transduction histidine kinase
LWIGYGGQGLGRLKAGRFTQYRMDQGLADDYISHILPDERGRLWLAGNTGIFSVFEQDLDDLAAGRSTRVRSVTYGRNDGLPRLQPSHGSWPGAVCTGRRLFFAMQSGVAVVYANEMEENKAPPNVVLDRVTVNGKTAAAYAGSESLTHPDAAAPLVELAQGRPHLRLPPGARQVEFVFTGLSFKRPDSIGFKYRLHGLDADWVEADTRRVAAYPQIPPGDYRFQVLACNSDGVWNETGAAVDLTIEPNWWETAWFRVLAPLAAAGLLGGGVLLVLRRRHRRQIQHLQLQRATERERARIAQDLHDDLGAGLTQISLNTAMAQNPSVPPALAGTLLDEIDQRSRTLVIALDEIVWAVNPKNDTTPSLARYFCQFAQNFLRSGNIACRLVVAPDLADAPVGSTQRHQLFLAFKEALHNALRHSGATELQLEITADTRSLTVTLADNGRGFSPGPVPEEGADGLDNMRARLERLGGTCQVTSAPGRGTTVVFRLPLADQRA